MSEQINIKEHISVNTQMNLVEFVICFRMSLNANVKIPIMHNIHCVLTNLSKYVAYIINAYVAGIVFT